MSSVIVFIEGPAPTEADRKLFEEVEGNQFLNVRLVGGSVVKHCWVTAVDPKIIPEGYNTEKPELLEEIKAPVANPTAPFQAPAQGPVGIQADNTPPVATGIPALPFSGVKAD